MIFPADAVTGRRYMVHAGDELLVGTLELDDAGRYTLRDARCYMDAECIDSGDYHGFEQDVLIALPPV